MKKLFAKLRNPKVYRPLFAGIGIAAIIAALLFYELRRDRIFIDDSLVSAPVTSIAPPTAGTLTQLSVYEGEMIKKGDTVAVIDGETVRTDTDGLVIQASNQIGSSVNPQSTIVQIINPSDMRIAGTIDENKGMDQIRVGQAVSFTVDALPGKTFWGYIDEVSPTAKQTQLSFSISSERPTQQFVIYARFDATKYPEIKNGMSAKMTVYTRTQ